MAPGDERHYEMLGTGNNLLAHVISLHSGFSISDPIPGQSNNYIPDIYWYVYDMESGEMLSKLKASPTPVLQTGFAGMSICVHVVNEDHRTVSVDLRLART